MYELPSTPWQLQESLYAYQFFFNKFCFNLLFLCNTIKNVITLKSKKQTNCNHLLLCCLTVKLTRIAYKNISYGNLVYRELLFEVRIVLEQTLKKTEFFFGTKCLLGEPSFKGIFCSVRRNFDLLTA